VSACSTALPPFLRGRTFVEQATRPQNPFGRFSQATQIHVWWSGDQLVLFKIPTARECLCIKQTQKNSYEGFNFLAWISKGYVSFSLHIPHALSTVLRYCAPAAKCM
jgi:hypothetical protein